MRFKDHIEYVQCLKNNPVFGSNPLCYLFQLIQYHLVSCTYVCMFTMHCTHSLSFLAPHVSDCEKETPLKTPRMNEEAESRSTTIKSLKVRDEFLVIPCKLPYTFATTPCEYPVKRLS